ncbi:SDR family NAD(P)-dependent oxidoreductase [Lacihabitans lacunae]|uniref:SDR family NAD(P)-dependent oxidoreductase n=1 Tax=Lacihabitans lacunae TaxID=1028214 RepID=A0ABV7Z1Y0_9BACT
MNKIALITGASSGIGYATAIALAEKGYDLIITGRREGKLTDLEKTIDGKVKTFKMLFDVSDSTEVKAAFDKLPEEWKQIDVLVNNAGNAHGFGAIHEGEIADWELMIGSNIVGLLNVSKMVLPGMVSRQKGHVVNLSSVAGKQTYENGTVYCATKKSVEAISEGMRLDLTKHGIKVTNIAPGAVETEFSNIRFKGDTEKAKKVYEGFEPLLAVDIADAIAYCVAAPDHVTIADMTIYAKAQAAPTTVYRK